MALRIGITGNIGAGKTTVCRDFERLGVAVYYADVRAKELMNENPVLRRSIVNDFGPDSYGPDGRLDRAYLAERVFTDPAALARLNAHVHPTVAEDAAAWHRRQRGPYTLHEAAILLEIGSRDQYDGMIVVSCPYPIRMARVMQRDGISEEDFAARADKQWTDERKAAAADFLIHNDGRQLLLPQILATDRQLRRRAHQSLPAGV
ncbi:dephospho-CoA kinase [Neolewinella xylanilytica]|uniref:Dephospho-CoA kinase n=1 Tax=Neolewinella xylanilytica TaxID=1514080 RepID=A0A2S6I5I1_9BACT|nr:dephospho-CoA kinase [Neolewinella xylanilytica]PPK86412.1 dephospho-CoA kinase [Neolewinella xylanilytica]